MMLYDLYDRAARLYALPTIYYDYIRRYDPQRVATSGYMFGNLTLVYGHSSMYKLVWPRRWGKPGQAKEDYYG